jgi:plastocyanin
MKGFIAGAAIALSLLAPAIARADAPKAEPVRALDACDKPTWDATFGPGLCQRDAGGVTPAEWQSKMNPKDFGHGAWWFNVSGGRVGTTKLKQGDWFRVTNEGGEAHTFTNLEAYGGTGFTGGCIAPLSTPLGLSVFGGDCANGIANTTIQPGQTVDFAALPIGTYHFQCLFHPWMRQTVKVEKR